MIHVYGTVYIVSSNVHSKVLTAREASPRSSEHYEMTLELACAFPQGGSCIYALYMMRERERGPEKRRKCKKLRMRGKH